MVNQKPGISSIFKMRSISRFCQAKRGMVLKMRSISRFCQAKRGMVLIVVLLILIIGGFFIYPVVKDFYYGVYEYWWIPITGPEEIKFPIDKKVQDLKLEAQKQPEREEKLTPEQLIPKTQELIIEAQELIEKAEEFIEEKEKEKQLAIEKAVQEAYESSNNVKGVYMTEFIASSRNPAAIKIREDIKKLLDETELNAVVIDVKEAYGPNLPDSLKKLINEFHQSNIWVIARVVAFRDSSLMAGRPELYLKTKKGSFWKDWGGGYWLDPSSQEVWEYLIEFSQQVIDFGFDELQFDYVRFPTDGDLKDIVYPLYNKKKNKPEIIQEFYLKLSKFLKSYQPKIILSVDLFGLVATRFSVPAAGQRLQDVSDLFDYISFMLYPSHFYGGFEVKKDLARQLPSLYFPYVAEEISQVVSNHPYEVVFRSILSASDYLSSLASKSKIRPWLQDFNLKFDMERGIYYDAEKVRAQIKAAEDSDSSGWLLWSASNIYTEEALIK